MIKTVGLTANDIVIAQVMTKRLNYNYRTSVDSTIALFGGLYVSQSLTYDEPLGKATWLSHFPFQVSWAQFVDVMLEYVEATGWNMNMTAAEYNMAYLELNNIFQAQQNGGGAGAGVEAAEVNRVSVIVGGGKMVDGVTGGEIEMGTDIGGEEGVFGMEGLVP